MTFAFRQLRKSPGFTAVAVLSLALGIGANTAIFSLVNEFLLRSLPVREPERLVLFRTTEGVGGQMSRGGENDGTADPATGRFTSSSFSLEMLETFRAQPVGLTEVFGFSPLSQPNVVIDGQPEVSVTAQLVSGNYYTGLGVSAAAGRTLQSADDQTGAENVGVISFRYWENRFGRDPSVVGRSIVVNKVPVTIVGVSAEGFAGAGQSGESLDLSVPLGHHLQFQPDRPLRAQPWYWWVRLMGRLSPGTDRNVVRTALEPIFQSTARESWIKGQAFDATPRSLPGAPTLALDSGAQGLGDVRREYAKSLYVLLGLVALVLAVACANVANLLLARGEARRREFAVRLALGANRAVLIRQLLGESFLLAALGSAVGIAFAWWGRDLLLALHPFGGASAVFELPLDGRVLAFTLVVTFATALLFGLAPALRSTRLNLSEEFQGGTRSLGGGRRSRLSSALMVVQVALSMVMLVSTGLFVRTLRNLQDVNAGFNRSHLALFAIDATAAGYTRDQFNALHERLLERVTRLPGVTAATFSRVPLLSRTRQNNTIIAPGFAPPADAVRGVHMNSVAPNFFAVMQLPLALGRAFNDHDNAAAPKVAIVNRVLAQRYFGAENPIGRQILLNLSFAEPYALEIVGISTDAKYADLRSPVPPTLYLPAAQRPGGAANFALRTAGDPTSIFAAIRTAVREIDPTLPALNLRTQDEQVNRLHAQQFLFARLSGAFGLLALALSCVGLYGLMSYNVLRRTGEIGVRMALGALPRQVLQMILRESLILVSGGVMLGLIATAAAGRLVATLLFGLSAVDPITYSAVAALLLFVALAAAFLPARRAAKISPMTALRSD